MVIVALLFEDGEAEMGLYRPVKTMWKSGSNDMILKKEKPFYFNRS